MIRSHYNNRMQNKPVWSVLGSDSLLHVAICCPPSVLVSSVQGLTDHPCCAAGSSKNQNHNSEEHLDAGSAIVCVAEIWGQLIYSCGIFTDLPACVTTVDDKVLQLWRWILQHTNFDFCYYVVVTHFASVYVFNDCTSHLLSLSNLGIQCVYLDKDKGLPNKTWRLRYVMKCREFTFALTFGRIGSAGL